MIHPRTSLVMPSLHHRKLVTHLFPGDGLEAAALLLCHRVGKNRQRYLVYDIIPVPHSACARRERDALSWSGEYAELAVDRAEEGGYYIVALHSHPGGLFDFSSQDNASDKLLLPALYQATGRPSMSAIMVPSGAVRARVFNGHGTYQPVDLVVCASDDIQIWPGDAGIGSRQPVIPVAFSQGMRRLLGRLSACVVGVSGTGSIVAEQLARLGFGEIILVDFDRIEFRNLDRILNATTADAAEGKLKVEMFKDAIRRYSPDCQVHAVPDSITTRDAVQAACEADVLLSCVDTVEGRHIADRLAAACVLPLFDVGVSIPTRHDGRERKIAEVCGRIDYVQPGGATLLDRNVYSPATLEAEYLARAAPEAHRNRVAEGYFKGMAEQAPAVISLNMRAASATVMEFIARAFPFRHTSNREFARTVFMLADGEEEHFAEDSFVAKGALPICTGLQEPLLGLPGLAPRRKPHEAELTMVAIT
jgi:proteasome lid subunit RPN8/RPN11